MFIPLLDLLFCLVSLDSKPLTYVFDGPYQRLQFVGDYHLLCICRH